MKNIAIVTNFNISEKANAALKVANYLLNFNCKILVSQYSKDRVLAMKKYKGNIYFLPIEKLYDEADLVIALGGDGTILDCAKKMAKRGKPILGINLGHLGYMAELEMDELRLLSGLFEGKFEIVQRSMLSVTMLDIHGQPKLSSFALNDAVISGSSVARMIDVELRADGELVSTYRADGLIVATPTGSTAYSMAAGGAICDPSLNCFCVTPICPHSLTARPLIFPDSAKLEVRNICNREKNLFLTIDGRTNYELFRGETVCVTRSDKTTGLIKLRERSFYSTLREKMANG